MTIRNLLLRNKQSPGDVLMLTAAVRDLHRQHPGRFRTRVETTAMGLWEGNPNVEGRMTNDEKEKWEVIECRYPLIHKSNTGAWHFIHAFHHFLSERLGVRLEPGEFRGDIHLSAKEKSWISQVEEMTRVPVPFWIVVSGGKRDFTAKWWDPARMQAVVDHFAGRILFVQTGEAGHHHPPLRGVIDLRGKTDTRQFVRLMYHAQGVVCPVTFAMHLAAAVPVKWEMQDAGCGMRDGRRGQSTINSKLSTRTRPCVVIAGGREPSQWEAYPGHQYIHTIGALACCAHGGCWKSRVLPLGDGDRKDASLCVDVVELTTGVRKRGEEWGREMTKGRMTKEEGGRIRDARYGMRDGERDAGMTKEEGRRKRDAGRGLSTINFQPSTHLPRCLDMITAEEVIRRIEMYFDGGAVDYLTKEQAAAASLISPSRGLS